MWVMATIAAPVPVDIKKLVVRLLLELEVDLEDRALESGCRRDVMCGVLDEDGTGVVVLREYSECWAV